jgi:hypothetical protein
VDLKDINKYKINETLVLSETDKKHIENYQQLIKFFESAVNNSLSDNKTNYNALHASCIQCIRFLDNLIFTYESGLNSAKLVNQTIEKIIKDHSQEEVQGNEEDYQTPL